MDTTLNDAVNVRDATICIVIPVFNEGSHVESLVRDLITKGQYDQIIVVDASTDHASQVEVARLSTCFPGSQLEVTQSTRPGRAEQMNIGAHHARCDVLLFLHADTMLPPTAAQDIQGAIKAGHSWGRFDVRLAGESKWFRVIERAMNLRSAITHIATGDQAIFVRRDLFVAMGGYASMAIMEDIDLCRRLRLFAKAVRLRNPVVTSARRWINDGIVYTILQMWTMRFLFWIGVDASRLARWYRDSR